MQPWKCYKFWDHWRERPKLCKQELSIFVVWYISTSSLLKFFFQLFEIKLPVCCLEIPLCIILSSLISIYHKWQKKIKESCTSKCTSGWNVLLWKWFCVIEHKVSIKWICGLRWGLFTGIAFLCKNLWAEIELHREADMFANPSKGYWAFKTSEGQKQIWWIIQKPEEWLIFIEK